MVRAPECRVGLCSTCANPGDMFGHALTVQQASNLGPGVADIPGGTLPHVTPCYASDLCTYKLSQSDIT